VRSGAVLATCGDEPDVPLAAAVHHGKGLIALGGAGRHARVHRSADGALVMAGRHGDFVLTLGFTPDGTWLAAGDRAGIVQVWETGTGRVFQSLTGHQGAVHALAFDRTGKALLTAGADGTLRLWDVAAAKERWRQAAHPNQQVLACAFGPGEAIASCGSDGVIALFTAAGKPVAKSAPAGDWLYAVAFGASDDEVFAGDWQGRVHRFGVKEKDLTAVTPLAPAH
jgi:WD40 repeat protein